MQTPEVPKLLKREFISVQLAPQETQRLKQFYCCRCGKLVFEYHDEVSLIMDGRTEEPELKIPVIVLCRGYTDVRDRETGMIKHVKCHAKYYVQ